MRHTRHRWRAGALAPGAESVSVQGDLEGGDLARSGGCSAAAGWWGHVAVGGRWMGHRPLGLGREGFRTLELL